MRSPNHKGEPARRTLRHFAWIVALGLLVLARFCEQAEQTYLAVVSAVIFSIGTVLPRTFLWPYKLALIGLYPFGWLATIIFALTMHISLRRPLGVWSRLAYLIHRDKLSSERRR